MRVLSCSLLFRPTRPPPSVRQWLGCGLIGTSLANAQARLRFSRLRRQPRQNRQLQVFPTCGDSVCACAWHAARRVPDSPRMQGPAHRRNSGGRRSRLRVEYLVTRQLRFPLAKYDPPNSGRRNKKKKQKKKKKKKERKKTNKRKQPHKNKNKN